MTGEAGLLGAREVRELAEQVGLTPTKKLGQNFVVDPNTVRKIVSLADLSASATVLEVGPGLGSLTLGLLAAADRVIAIELDPGLAAQLPATVQQFNPARAKALTVVAGDAMTVDLAALPQPTEFVANLPYNVAVPVIIRILSECPTVNGGLVMVQLEVAKRLAAQPGTADYGIPSVKLQWFGEVAVVSRISPNVFWPVPRVDSGLVSFRRCPSPPSRASRAEVFACIDAAFSQRRKKLRSALTGWAGSIAAADDLLAAAGQDSAARAENLTLVDFIAIADARHRQHTT